MVMQPTLLVLAAGMGSRYGGLKQIDPVGPHGETIIDYSIHDAVQAGFGKVVFVIRKDIEAPFKEFLGNRLKGKIEVDFAFQELNALPAGFSVPEGRSKPWGTGHAILVAQELVKTPCLVINGDDFYGRESFVRAAKFLQKAQDKACANYCMVGYQLGNTLSENGSVSRGICEVSSGGHLKGVKEYTKINREQSGIVHREEGLTREFTGEEPTSMNMFGFTPSIFKHLEVQFKEFLKARGQELKSELYIPSVVNRLIEESKAEVTVLNSPEQWFGVTYKEDRESVSASIRALIASGKYPQKLF
jgi:UTP-glucose-1-phosphate uridylyltransferase